MTVTVTIVIMTTVANCTCVVSDWCNYNCWSQLQQSGKLNMSLIGQFKNVFQPITQKILSQSNTATKTWHKTTERIKVDDSETLHTSST